MQRNNQTRASQEATDAAVADGKVRISVGFWGISTIFILFFRIIKNTITIFALV